MADTIDDKRAVDDDLMARIFPDKAAEKRHAWAESLLKEEYDTVGSLRTASEAAWNAIALPLAVRDQLRAFVARAAAVPSQQLTATTTTTTATTTVPKAEPTKAETAKVEETKAAEAFVDRRPIGQIDVIVFDVSSSMNARSFDADKTRLEAGKILLQTMVDRFAGQELSHALSLLLFGERITTYPFTRNCTVFENTLGNAPANECSTKLYDSIWQAGKNILEFRAQHSAELEQPQGPAGSSGCRNRIFVLTDGQDNASVAKHWEVARFLQDNEIILDVFPLAGENSSLQQMAVATGGLCITVSDTETGVGVFEREAVLHVSVREPRKEPLPVIVSEASLTALASEARPATEIRRAVPTAVTAPVHTAASLARAESTTTTSCSRRVFKEYREAMDNHVAGLEFFINADDCTFWKVILDGPSGTPYEGFRWLLSVRFPPTYPFQPPDVRFITKIYHVNVNDDGRICLDILRSNWSPALNITKVLLSIHAMLQDPNADDPLDARKAHIFKQDRARYDAEAKASAQAHASASADELKAAYHLV